MTRVCRARVVGAVVSGERDAESSREVGEIVGSPTVTQGDRDGDRLRESANGEVSRIADECREQHVHVELVQQEGQQRSRPPERGCTIGEQAKAGRSKRATPVLEISLTLSP
ncbi:MAG TPA: hypothetical protein VLV86_01595 [Vicinamibacterales bacterium]|nr:hypothetical protein [Vicinamibacterales bacterium]